MTTVTNTLRQPKAKARFMRGLVVFHRWMGIVLCLFFAMWFVTGAIMMYVPYPFLGDGARIAKGSGVEGLHPG